MKANYVGGRGNKIGVICKMLIELTNYDELGLTVQFCRMIDEYPIIIQLSILIRFHLSDEKMSFLGATLGNLHIPSIGGIKKQISKVWTTKTFIRHSRASCNKTLEGKVNWDLLTIFIVGL